MREQRSPWGEDLHSRPFSTPAHYPQLASLFGPCLEGRVLEIGCGSGTDAAMISTLPGVEHVFALDLGVNVLGLRHPRVSFVRASALGVPLPDGSVDSAYSFGVFHHTEDPSRCIAEAHRVLKPGGCLLLYLYSAHETNLFKHAGVRAETFLMAIMSRLPVAWGRAVCWLLSPAMWLLFSVPAMLLRLLGLRAQSLPMHWGTHPFSLVEDLKDRLLAPVNHRFTRPELLRMLGAFSVAEVVHNPAGLYARCTK